MQSFTSGHALQKRVRRWRRVDMIIFSLALSIGTSSLSPVRPHGGIRVPHGKDVQIRVGIEYHQT